MGAEVTIGLQDVSRRGWKVYTTMKKGTWDQAQGLGDIHDDGEGAVDLVQTWQ